MNAQVTNIFDNLCQKTISAFNLNSDIFSINSNTPDCWIKLFDSWDTYSNDDCNHVVAQAFHYIQFGAILNEQKSSAYIELIKAIAEALKTDNAVYEKLCRSHAFRQISHKCFNCNAMINHKHHKPCMYKHFLNYRTECAIRLNSDSEPIKGTSELDRIILQTKQWFQAAYQRYMKFILPSSSQWPPEVWNDYNHIVRYFKSKYRVFNPHSSDLEGIMTLCMQPDLPSEWINLCQLPLSDNFFALLCEAEVFDAAIKDICEALIEVSKIVTAYYNIDPESADELNSEIQRSKFFEICKDCISDNNLRFFVPKDAKKALFDMMLRVPAR